MPRQRPDHRPPRLSEARQRAPGDLARGHLPGRWPLHVRRRNAQPACVRARRDHENETRPVKVETCAPEVARPV